jgi:hypothetical protein
MQTRMAGMGLFILLLVSVAAAQNADARISFINTIVKHMGNKLLPGHSFSAGGADDTQFIFHAPAEDLTLECDVMLQTKGFASSLREFGFTQYICTDDGTTNLSFDLLSGKQQSSNQSAAPDFNDIAGGLAVLLIPALLGAIPGYIAKKKGRSLIGWWVYGVAMFIVALPHSLLIKSVSRETASPAAT